MVTKPYFSETKAKTALTRAINSDWKDAEEFGTILLDFSYHAVDWIRPHHGDRDDHAMRFCEIALRYLKNGGYKPGRGTLFNYLTKIASTKVFTYSKKIGHQETREAPLSDMIPSKDQEHDDTIEVLKKRFPSKLVDELTRVSSPSIGLLSRRTGISKSAIRWYLYGMQRTIQDKAPLGNVIVNKIRSGVQLCLEL